MAEDSNIAWTDDTFNPWIGCTKVAKGCFNCYAEATTARYKQVQWGRGGDRRMTGPDNWKKPLRWNRAALKSGETRRVFCASLCDILEDWKGDIVRGAENTLMEGWTMQDIREKVFELIEATPALTWMLLTKRPQNRHMFPERWMTHGFPSNVWLGTSVACQEDIGGIKHLHKYRELCKVLFVSAEPLVGSVELKQDWFKTGEETLPNIDWLIVGGESDAGVGEARPCNMGWVWRLKNQAQEAGWSLFIKQLGDNFWHRFGGHHSKHQFVADKGGDPAEWPELIRIQDHPLDRSIPDANQKLLDYLCGVAVDDSIADSANKGS